MTFARKLFLLAPAMGALLASAAASGARADTPEEAGSAMGACLAAVIDGAPVADLRRGDVAVHRETDPNLCKVQVDAGDPAAVRAAVMAAVAARREQFAPMRTPWDAGAFASREGLCNGPMGRRHFNVMVETARAGGTQALLATVLETPTRDERCDLDYGTQRP